MSEKLCYDHNKRHVYSESECPWCEIDRLKAELEEARYDRKMALIDEQYLVDAEIENKDLERQLAEVKHELETTQLHLMEEETTRKIWEQDCKKAESQLAELQQLQVEIVESAGSTQQHLLAQLAEARAKVEEVNVYKKYVQIEGGGPTYCLHGSSSIAAFTALEVKLAEVRAELASYKAGVEVEGVAVKMANVFPPKLISCDFPDNLIDQRVRVLVCPQAEVMKEEE